MDFLKWWIRNWTKYLLYCCSALSTVLGSTGALADLLRLESCSQGFYSPVGFPGGASGKEPTSQCRRYKKCGFDAWVRKIPWRRTWQSTPVFLPGEFPMDRGAWWATVHGVAKSRTHRTDLTRTRAISIVSLIWGRNRDKEMKRKTIDTGSWRGREEKGLGEEGGQSKRNG